jgi:hypothetical protein
MRNLEDKSEKEVIEVEKGNENILTKFIRNIFGTPLSQEFSNNTYRQFFPGIEIVSELIGDCSYKANQKMIKGNELPYRFSLVINKNLPENLKEYIKGFATKEDISYTDINIATIKYKSNIN